MAVAASATRSIICGLASTPSALARSTYGSSSASFATFGKVRLGNALVVGLKKSSYSTRSHSNAQVCMASRALSSVAVEAATVTIKVGDKLPEAELSYLDKDNNVQTVKVSELTEGKKVVIFAVPGAFTPTCSQKHVPGFVDKSDELKSKGIDAIACVSVNDVFVMKAWGESLGVGDKVMLLSDGNLHFTKALGVELDLSDKPVGLAVRSRRYALLADNGVVKQLNLEDGGAFSVSGPEEILKLL